ncbi:MAG: DJ-1/PfpI family protein [Deltaproteobacteria bacterium]|nr:DJ-1/PfpI family protein [Deltaproteobacteria bacterium]
MAKVLVPLPDRDFDPTESAVPWHTLIEAGHDVVFATERGAVAACDPLLLTGVIFGQLGAKEGPKKLYAEMAASKAFASPITWSAIDVTAFDALLLPGGHAPGMKQYLASDVLQSKVAAFARTGKPMAAICHGVLVLARAKDPETGKSVLAGRRTTCLPKYMERTAYLLTAWKLGRYYRTYDAYVEDEVVGALDDPARFERGPFTLTRHGTPTSDAGAFVVEDGAYVSARWPGDAHLFAKKLVDRL